MRLFRVPDEKPLEEYDPELARRLARLLVEILVDELVTPEPEARRLAGEVVWTVTRERDGWWLNLAHGDQRLGVGGDWRPDEDGLTLYVRQMAYILVGREHDFEP